MFGFTVSAILKIGFVVFVPKNFRFLVLVPAVVCCFRSISLSVFDFRKKIKISVENVENMMW